tara:strand:- start:245 stop:466 length:222 start_codon:yes stop_codon:yes gene_type:complete
MSEIKWIDYYDEDMPELIAWSGGKCPVDPDRLVEVKIRGCDNCTYIANAGHPDMEWGKSQNPDCEIVGYRVVA